MNHYLLTLFIGFGLFMGFVSWSIYAIFKMAHDEDPGCLDPRH